MDSRTTNGTAHRLHETDEDAVARLYDLEVTRYQAICARSTEQFSSLGPGLLDPFYRYMRVCINTRDLDGNWYLVICNR